MSNSFIADTKLVLLDVVKLDNLPSVVVALFTSLSKLVFTSFIADTKLVLFVVVKSVNLPSVVVALLTSSFNKFVKSGVYEQDWCNFDDKYNIKNLSLEWFCQAMPDLLALCPSIEDYCFYDK